MGRALTQTASVVGPPDSWVPIHLTLAELLDLVRRRPKLELLQCLAELREADVSTIAASTDSDPSAVSHVLRRLQQSGLVEFQQEGQRHVYRLSPVIGADLSAKKLELTIRTWDGVRLAVSMRRRA